MLRRSKSVFQGEKKLVRENFWKFLKFLASLTANIKAAPPSAVITIQQKVPRDIFIYNIQKFKLISLLVFS